MSTDKKIFDDLARMAGGAVNMMSGLQQQMRDDMRSRFDDVTARLDLVTRQDFDELQALVTELHAKIARLEDAAGRKPPVAKSRAQETDRDAATRPPVAAKAGTAGKSAASRKKPVKRAQ